ncbi:CPK2 [Symbiodinium natans]|uniref:CPK2 protein n=1 Tax=Symbiodinium natans TaxID=878477 RepID=A0A812TMT5_9DINO|nr:CPK2 [Symbiodinium natans]
MQDATSQMTALSTAYPAPSPGLGGLCLPGVSCRGQSTSPPQGREVVFAPPTAMATPETCPQAAVPGPSQVTREDCEAQLPGATSHLEVQAPPTLAIRSRQANAPPVTIGIPIPSRRDVEQVNYVTETVTTPEKKGRRAPGPVPLLSFKSNASLSSERGVAPYSRSKSSGALSGEIPHATPTSSFSSVNSTFVSKQMTSTSFRWAPGDALVHCWHRKLSDTYQDYNMVNLVGEGRNGAVFIVQHKVSEQYYACKVLHKAEQDSGALRAEIKNLRMLDHPNVVRLYEVNEDAEAVFLLMEYCCGGDLFSLVTESPNGHLAENVARSFAEQMLMALAYCHSMGIVHRDVKPENFLLEGTVEEDAAGATLKLADFGIATHIRCPESQAEGQVNGSVPYMAPELFSKRWSSLVRDSQGDRHALAASDLWSCAIVIYVMLSGDLPYGSDEYRIASGEPPDFSKEVWQTVSPEAIDLIRKLLQPEVEERWTAPQALRHEWFSAMKTTRASPESLGNRSIFTDRSEGLGFSQSSAELARTVLRSLRRWRQHPFLRRMVIAGIAKRMEADNPSRKFAETAYQAFKGSQDKLRNEQLVQVLNSAFCGSSPPPDASCSSLNTASNESFLQAGESVRTTRSNSSSGSAFSPSGRSVTGLYVRQHMKQSFRKFMRRLDEDSTLGSSPVSLSPGFPTPGSEDLVSLTELEVLVEKLDATKNGTVDYTLFVAALLPMEVYCEESRAMEMFGQLDITGRGLIGPDDVQKVLSTSLHKKDNNIRRFTEMVKEFDLNGDGYLDPQEFRKMLRAEEPWSEGACTDNLEEASAFGALGALPTVRRPFFFRVSLESLERYGEQGEGPPPRPPSIRCRIRNSVSGLDRLFLLSKPIGPRVCTGNWFPDTAAVVQLSFTGFAWSAKVASIASGSCFSNVATAGSKPHQIQLTSFAPSARIHRWTIPRRREVTMLASPSVAVGLSDEASIYQTFAAAYSTVCPCSSELLLDFEMPMAKLPPDASDSVFEAPHLAAYIREFSGKQRQAVGSCGNERLLALHAFATEQLPTLLLQAEKADLVCLVLGGVSAAVMDPKAYFAQWQAAAQDAVLQQAVVCHVCREWLLECGLVLVHVKLSCTNDCTMSEVSSLSAVRCAAHVKELCLGPLALGHSWAARNFAWGVGEGPELHFPRPLHNGNQELIQIEGGSFQVKALCKKIQELLHQPPPAIDLKDLSRAARALAKFPEEARGNAAMSMGAIANSMSRLSTSDWSADTASKLLWSLARCGNGEEIQKHKHVVSHVVKELVRDKGRRIKELSYDGLTHLLWAVAKARIHKRAGDRQTVHTQESDNFLFQLAARRIMDEIERIPVTLLAEVIQIHHEIGIRNEKLFRVICPKIVSNKKELRDDQMAKCIKAYMRFMIPLKEEAQGFRTMAVVQKGDFLRPSDKPKPQGKKTFDKPQAAALSTLE